MRKFLSLVLALAMAMSLVVVNTSAKEFTDSDDLNYKEAVDVISEIGVVDGYTDGSFNPQGGLTRGAAAKIICNLILGPTTAAELRADTRPFSDVAVDSEFAGYIAYCAQQGIISGYADGEFKAANPLTGYAFMKMLLGALGYSTDIENYVGENWSINVAKQAIGIGLNQGLVDEFNGVDYVTREEAALYAFNTLKATLVDYDNTISANVNGAEVVISNNTAKPVTWSEGINEDGNIKDDGFVQFAEEFFPDLVRHDDETKFMEPANTWTYDKTEIGTYERLDLIVETYTTGVTGRDLYDLLKPGVIDNNDLEVYVDGQEAKGDATLRNNFYEVDEFDKDDMVRANTDSVGATGNGVLTKVYLDTDKDLITIVSINTWLAQAAADYNEANEYAPLNVFYDEDNASRPYNVDVEEVENVVDVTEDTFYQVNMSWKDNDTQGEIVVINDVEVLEDSTISEYSSDDGNAATADGRVTDLTTGGEDYDGNVMAFYDSDVLYQYDQALLTDATYNVYLDQYGYFLGVELFEGSKNYVFITGFDRNSSNLAVKTATAGAIFLDGTMENIEVNVTATDKNIDKANDNHVANEDNGNHFVKWATTGYDQNDSVWADHGKYGEDGIYDLNQWYTYTVNESGVYTLKPAARMTQTTYNPTTGTNMPTSWSTGDDVVIRTDNLSVSDDLDVDGRVYGEDESVFLTVDLDVVDTSNGEYAITDVNGVYTGIQSVDILVDLSANAVEKAQVYTVFDSDGYIIAAVIIGEARGNTGNLAYILSDAKSEGYADGVYTWKFDAIMDGAKQTLTARSSYSDTIDALDPYTVQELRFDGDYVVDVKDVDDLYTNFLREVNGEDVYVADGRNGASNEPTIVRFQNNTLYVTQSRDDHGLYVMPDAKAVVIQPENNKSEVITNFSSVSQAINHLADANNDATDGKQYKGEIWAVLNSNGSAEWVVFKSEIPLLTGSQGEQQVPGVDGLLTYRVQNLGGYAFINWTLRTPEYASDGATVTYAIDVLANGIVIDSATVAGTFNADLGSTSGNWSGPVFDEKANVTMRVRTVSPNGVAVKYVNEAGDLLFLDSWDDTKDYNAVAHTGFDSAPTFWVWNNSASTIGFEMTTNGLGEHNLSYSIAGVTSPVSKTAFATDDDTAQSVSVTAKGDQFVVVTIYGIGTGTKQYDITLEAGKFGTDAQAGVDHVDATDTAVASAAKRISYFFATPTATANDTLKVDFTQVKDINPDVVAKIGLSVTVGLATPPDNRAYDVVVTINNKPYTFRNVTTASNTIWLDATGDMVVNSVVATPSIENLAVKGTAAAPEATVAGDGMSMTINFNENVTKTDLSRVDAGNFTGSGIAVTSVDVYGDSVVLHFNEKAANGDTITIAGICGGSIAANTISSSTDVITIALSGTPAVYSTSMA